MCRSILLGCLTEWGSLLHLAEPDKVSGGRCNLLHHEKEGESSPDNTTKGERKMSCSNCNDQVNEYEHEDLELCEDCWSAYYSGLCAGREQRKSKAK